MMDVEETIEIKREPLSNSNLNAPIESTHFEKEKERLVKEIGHVSRRRVKRVF